MLPDARLSHGHERTPVNYSPRDLAHVVCDVLGKRGIATPRVQTLVVLFETMYFTSLRTEEGSSLSCHVIWLDPGDPDPERPARLSGDRWTFIPLADPIPLTVRSLAKLSRATDPRTSSFVVYGADPASLHLYGFVDQGNQFYEFINDSGGTSPERPGLFQASIEGVGHLIVHTGYEIIAELRMNELAGTPIDVLSSGPVFQKLRPHIIRHIVEVMECVAPDAYESGDDWPASLANTWIASLCRLLLRCQNYRHGGALLITPERVAPGLNQKYALNYDRLPRALIRRGAHEIMRLAASRTLRNDYLNAEDPHRIDIPCELYLDESLNDTYVQEATNAVDGAIWFVSLLSRVDGLVLLDPSLRVRAFGVEITIADDPGDVYLACDAEGTEELLQEFDYGNFGTRHRSMIRYCAGSPDSLGFVISQDGDVRAIANVNGRVLVWDNIALRLDAFLKGQATSLAKD